jgi:hypothetical protein
MTHCPISVSGGQKSTHECFLSEAERVALLWDFRFLLNACGRFSVARLDPLARVLTIAVTFSSARSPAFVNREGGAVADFSVKINRIDEQLWPHDPRGSPANA